MSIFDYLISLFALISYFFIGRYITIKIANNRYKLLLLKYYSLSFVLAIVAILIVHYAYVSDGNLDGLPQYNDYGNDSIRYITCAKVMIDEGIYTNAVETYKVGSAYTYVLLIYIQFMIFGINTLVIIFFNALLYSLSLVLFGKFASFFFDLKNVKRSLLFFILSLSFLSYIVIPLKETLVIFLALIVLISIQNLSYKLNYRSLLLLLLGIFLLFFTRAYVAVILFASSIPIIFVKGSIKKKFINTIVIALGLYFIVNFQIGGMGLAHLYQEAYFNIGVWKQEGNITGRGFENALKVITSGKINYITMVYYQTLQTFFNPFFTSYPRRESVLSTGTYIKSFLFYSASFLWYFLLPSIIYGFIHIVKNRKDLLILYLPPILFFVFFTFMHNQLRYQIVTKIFWILIGVYGLQYYSKWKKYITFWIIFYIAIAIVTL